VAARRKGAKTGKAKAKPAKSAAKAKPGSERARSGSDGSREVHYSDLRKVMLASVLKRLK
jgi:hypothetical protein